MSKRKLSEMGAQELYYALRYVEGITLGATNKTQQLREIIETESLRPDDFEEELQKLYLIYEEMDQKSIEIENAMDAKYKPLLGLKYGTKTLADVSKRLNQQVVKERKKQEEFLKNTKKSGLQVR